MKTSYEVKELDENDGYSLGWLKLELCGPENKLFQYRYIYGNISKHCD